ncbi:hypothetical protein NP233_g5204 [Leucocoprinus birnbaumii]|uniref:Uncharacterized protein n=1 Tax=Leucocoprinus birnbaumii TaxID=56174 RepID=A0AAD5VTC0_9AGAR|nr:hypothetical protein NP233_g5204 [Leucocoprinus birnbaumii]
MHYAADAFKWIHQEPVYGSLDCYAPVDKPWKKRWRCKNCGACIASYHEKNGRWSVWGALLERDEQGKVKHWEELKPTLHMFYGTRLLDANDDLPKWAGYDNESERLG